MSPGNPARTRSSVPSISARGFDPAAPRTGNVTALAAVRPGTDNKYRVLLAHDLTAASEVAFLRAARLALGRKGHLTILHVVDSALPAKIIDAQRAHAQAYLEREVRRWLGRDRLSLRIDVGVGDTAGAVTARAHAHDVDLVVTGRHHGRGFADLFASRMIARLLRQVRPPVLVSHNLDQSPYRRMLVPFEITEAAAARIRFAAALLPQAGLHLLHAEKKPQQAVPAFIAALELGARRPLVTVESGHPLLLVERELARQKTDLLVLGARADSGSAETILRSCRCDVLFHA